MIIQDKVAVLPGVDVVLQGIAIETQLVFVAIQSEQDEENRTEYYIHVIHTNMNFM